MTLFGNLRSYISLNKYMNNIHFTLRAQGKSEPMIILNISDSRFNGRRFRYSTGKSIDADLWLKKKERAKIIPAKERELTALNDHLDKITQCAIDFMSIKFSSKTIVKDELVNRLEELQIDEVKEHKIKKQNELEKEELKLEAENGFYTIWEKIICSTKNKEGLPLSEGTKTSKRQTLNLIKEYCTAHDKKLTFETLDKNFYHAFTAS